MVQWWVPIASCHFAIVWLLALTLLLSRAVFVQWVYICGWKDFINIYSCANLKVLHMIDTGSHTVLQCTAQVVLTAIFIHENWSHPISSYSGAGSWSGQSLHSNANNHFSYFRWQICGCSDQCLYLGADPHAHIWVTQGKSRNSPSTCLEMHLGQLHSRCFFLILGDILNKETCFILIAVISTLAEHF